MVSTVLEKQNESSITRRISIASIDYSEIVSPWQVREFLVGQSRINNDLGVIGIALAETFLVRPSQFTRAQIFVLTTIAFALIIALGIFLANRVTNPLLRVVEASSRVAQGDLEVQVDAAGDDEVAVLAHSFNYMVAGMREGSLYRDLFGRTVSPEIRDQLRQGFASGDLRLEGQEAVATVLMSDIRSFTPLSENEAPATVFNWLNEYFGELVPIIAANGGVISRFEGDSVLAFFGLLPRPIPPKESAYRACKAALSMLESLEHLNARRTLRGDPPFLAGIGINTGPVTGGALGSSDRLHYTIIGDTVNTTARLENLTRQFGDDSSVVISQHTLFALRDWRHQFSFEAKGVHTVRGKEEQLLVYQLKPPKESDQGAAR
jgi:adenylate cyclase